MTQKTDLLHWFKTNRTITPKQAWAQLGIYRLSDTVLKLRGEGHLIHMDLIGDKPRYGRYTYLGGPSGL